MWKSYRHVMIFCSFVLLQQLSAATAIMHGRVVQMEWGRLVEMGNVDQNSEQKVPL